MAERRITGPVNSPGRPQVKVLQVVNSQVSAQATGTTVMVGDDSIPQITEGDEYMTLAITPDNTSNTLIIQVVLILRSDTAGNDRMITALFQDSTADALAGAVVHDIGADSEFQIVFTHKMTAGTIAATTFRVRAGSVAAGTTTVNANNIGNVEASSITIWEIEA